MNENLVRLKQLESQKLQAEVDKFLENGGTIVQIPLGATADSYIVFNDKAIRRDSRKTGKWN